MSVLYHVFIDTSAYEKADFLITGTARTAILNLYKQNRLKLYTTSITTGEIKNRITEKVKPLIDQILGLKRCQYLTEANCIEDMGIDSGRIATLDAKDVRNRIKENIHQRFHSLMEEIQSVNISLNGIDVEDLAARYLESKPPFSVADGKDKASTTRKKHEFPDALALMAINRYAADLNIKIHVVSSDSDFSAICQDFTNIDRVHGNLNELFNFIIETEVVDEYERAKNVIDENIDSFSESIERVIQEQGVDILDVGWDDEFELDSVAPIKIDLDSIDIIDVEEGYAEVYFKANITVNGVLTYRDEEMSVYDKEDDKYVIEEIRKRDIEENIDINVNLRVEFDANDNTNIKGVIVNNGKGVLLSLNCM